MSKYLFKSRENYNPRRLTPFPEATMGEIQTPKLCCNRPQGPIFTVSSCIPIRNIAGRMFL